ncbi:MAG: hypothetical protein MK171_12100 [Pirellulales bacterium]|nr:hypothetical protein [Pirellulales bacterium]
MRFEQSTHLLAAFGTESLGTATAAILEPHTLLLASLVNIGLTLHWRCWARERRMSLRVCLDRQLQA